MRCLKQTCQSLLFIVFFFFGSSQALAKTWYEIKSDNFVLYTDNRESVGIKLVEDLEYFRYFLQSLTNVENTQATLPLEVFAYRKNEDFREETGAGENTGGFFTTHFEGTTAFLYTPNGANSAGRQILFHEYVHYFMSQFSSFSYPKWYSEGFADYLSAFTFSKGTITVGQTLPDRVYTLNYYDWLPLKDIINSTGSWAVKDADGDQILSLYAQSWLTVHYLNGNPQDRQNLISYLQRINDGEEIEKAFVDTFDRSIHEMDMEVKRYWQKQRIPYTYYKLSGVEYKPEVSVRKLSPYEADFVRARAAGRRVYNAESLEKFEDFINEMVQAHPDGYGLKLVLADQKFRFGEGDVEKASAETVARIVAEHPEDSYANAIMGKVLFVEHFREETEEERANLLGQARTFLKKGIEIDPLNIYALDYMGRSYIFDQADNPAQGFKALVAAFDLVPQNSIFAFDLALLQARYGYLEEAEATFEYFLKFGYFENYIKAARFCLDEIRSNGDQHRCLFTHYDEVNKFGNSDVED